MELKTDLIVEDCHICYSSYTIDLLFHCHNSIIKNEEKPKKCNTLFCVKCICNPEWGKPHCLGCNQYIGRYDLVQFMGLSKYISAFSNHFKDIYFSREEKMLPVAQKYIEWKEYQELKQKNKRFLTQARARGFVVKPEYEIEFDAIATSIASVKNYFRCDNGNCAGVVMFGKCGICNQLYCDMCNQKTTSGIHKCDPSIVESLKEMRSTTKPCPSCYTPIIKGEGCNHMRCSNCGVRFEWTTMTIQISNSNPIKDNELIKKTSQLHNVLPEDTDKSTIENILWKVDPNIIATMMRTKFTVTKVIDKFQSDLMNIRVDYLKGKIDKDKWLGKILLLENDYDYKTQIISVMNKYLENISKTEKNYDERYGLITDINIQLIKISIAYGQKQFTLKSDNTNAYPIIGF